MTRRNTSQPREEFVALGNEGYNNALKAIMSTIGELLRSIEAWNNILHRLGEPVEEENSKITERRKEYMELVAKATKKIEEMNALHDKVTKLRTTPDQRVIGFVLHSEKIEVSVEPYHFTKDWALIELYNEKIDWPTFKGNKVYIGTSFSISLSPSCLHLLLHFPSPVFLSSVFADYYSTGGNLSIGDFGTFMFPQPVDQTNYKYPEDGLLQAYDIVQDKEFRNPQHLDVYGEQCLLVVKNGSATGTTVGRVNGLESFTRLYTDYGINHTSIEIAVLPYYNKRGSKFSEGGDSGSVVLARDGRIVGILTGGAGPTDETDITYLTPYWWVEQQIKAKYPGCFLYEVVQ
jgi:hypothetical protein